MFCNYSLKNLSVILLFLFVAPLGWAQGLNAELGFNAHHHQYVNGIAVQGDYTFLAKSHYPGSPNGQEVSIVKVDTNGIVYWQKAVTTPDNGQFGLQEIICDPSDGVYILFNGNLGCDLGMNNKWYVQRINGSGSVVSTLIFPETFPVPTEMAGLSKTANGEILIRRDSVDKTQLYTLDANLNMLDSIDVQIAGIESLDRMTGTPWIAAKQDSVHRIDASGNIITSLSFSSVVSDIKVWNDSLYILTTDSIFCYDNSWQQLSASNIPGYTNYTKLKVTNSNLTLASSGSNEYVVHYLDHNLTSLNSMTVSITNSGSLYADYSGTHVSFAESFDLTMFQTVRYRDYSLQSGVNANIVNPDVGIVAFDPTDIQVSIQNPPGTPYYWVRVKGKVLVKNFGTEIVDFVRINHYKELGVACGHDIFFNSYYGLNLQPGDSIWLDLGQVHNNMEYLPGSALNFSLCLYTSHPNSLTDLNVGNDEWCENLLLGYASINELQKDKKEVVKFFDLMGREVAEPKGLVIVQYSDGTTEKVFISN